jgi:hypothetical protein
MAIELIEVTNAVTAMSSSSQRGSPPLCLACGFSISVASIAR